MAYPMDVIDDFRMSKVQNIIVTFQTFWMRLKLQTYVPNKHMHVNVHRGKLSKGIKTHTVLYVDWPVERFHRSHTN